MASSHTYFGNLADELIPTDGILSRAVHKSDTLKAVLFAFDADQELSEHTASMPAIIQVLRGEARVTLGGETRDVAPGAWIHMPAHLRHSVHATTPFVMLLLLLKGEKAAAGSTGDATAT